MKQKHIAWLLLATFSILSLSLSAQQNASLCPEKPRLVLIICVDNLNNQQMEIVRPQCNAKGFNRLYSYGTQFTDAYYDAGGNFAGKNLATLFTGAPASTHGIVARQWIDSFSNKKVDAIYGSIPDNGRIDTLARPYNGALLCNTMVNEIRKIYNDKAKVFAIGFDPQMLVWSSGTYAGEPFAWLDPRTGNLQMSNIRRADTYKWIEEYNSKNLPDIYRTRIWTPRKSISEYHQQRYFGQKNASPFFYSMSTYRTGLHKYSALFGSPYGNTLMRDLAAAVLVNEEMGKDDIPDILMVQFTAMPSLGQKKQPIDPETEDILLGLDENIASLLQLVDRSVGMDNTLVVFTAAQGSYDVANTDSPQWAERGSVSLKKATALLNLYLMALYGQAQWVKNYAPGSVYLNREVADEKKVNFDTLLTLSAEFLVQVKGIGDAIPAKNLKTIVSTSPVIEAMRQNYHPKRSGDILIYLEPGWAEEQEDGTKLTQLWNGEFVPLVFYGWKIPKNIVYSRHSMQDVAPTICSFIKVAQPNGCSGKPITIF